MSDTVHTWVGDDTRFERLRGAVYRYPESSAAVRDLVGAVELHGEWMKDDGAHIGSRSSCIVIGPLHRFSM